MRSAVSRIVALAAFGLLALAACKGSETSGSGGGSSSTCGKAGRTGVTNENCGECSAGQYCDEADYMTCKPGCTSDANCGEAERCVRCGSAPVGTCQACARTDAEVCGGGGGSGPTSCTRNNFWDQDCVSPGKAYECPTNQDPDPSLGACVAAQLPGVFCCGGAAANSCFADGSDMQCDDPTHWRHYICVPPDLPAGSCVPSMGTGTYCCTN
jgi:hypothetical protein